MNNPHHSRNANNSRFSSIDALIYTTRRSPFELANIFLQLSLEERESDDILQRHLERLSSILLMTHPADLGYNVEKFIPELVKCLGKKEIPDIKSTPSLSCSHHLSARLYLHKPYSRY